MATAIFCAILILALAFMGVFLGALFREEHHGKHLSLADFADGFEPVSEVGQQHEPIVTRFRVVRMTTWD